MVCLDLGAIRVQAWQFFLCLRQSHSLVVRTLLCSSRLCPTSDKSCRMYTTSRMSPWSPRCGVSVGVPPLHCRFLSIHARWIDKEVQGYYEEGMTVPDDITLLWTDDKWVFAALDYWSCPDVSYKLRKCTTIPPGDRAKQDWWFWSLLSCTCASSYFDPLAHDSEIDHFRLTTWVLNLLPEELGWIWIPGWISQRLQVDYSKYHLPNHNRRLPDFVFSEQSDYEGNSWKQYLSSSSVVNIRMHRPTSKCNLL